MRIVIDLQGAQSDSRLRGIGRYSLALAQAMIEAGPEHEFIIALNGLFPDSIEPIRAQFEPLVGARNVRVWSAPPAVSAIHAGNTWRRHAAELMREAFLDSLDPDIVHITSLFDGFYDEAVHSVGLLPSRHATAVTFYDVIPLIESEIYLKPNPTYESIYREKIQHLQRADILLAISESSRQEAIKYVRASPEQVANIAAAADASFFQEDISAADKASLQSRYALHRPFVMYSGATDERKNHLRLIHAFSLLPKAIRGRYQLALVGRLPEVNREKFLAKAVACGLEPDELIITGGVTDLELRHFYTLCHVFAFPSWHEGFGLPALEAMACGAAVIGSNTTSVPEVIGRADALFDPFDATSIASKLEEVLDDEEFRQELRRHSASQAATFSWNRSARIALGAFERWHVGNGDHIENPLPRLAIEGAPQALINGIASLRGQPDSNADWAEVARAAAQNHPRIKRRQLYVDVSELVLRDSKSGIQRVVRSVLAALLSGRSGEYQVEPVFAAPGTAGYRYARSFKNRFLGLPVAREEDDTVEPLNGDIFIGLDLSHNIVIEQINYFRSLRDLGVGVFFVIYDLIPVITPWAYPEDADLSSIHSRWLDVLQAQTGVVCISRSVADEFFVWLRAFGNPRIRPLKIGWFHLGADVAQSVPSRGMTAESTAVLAELSKRPTFVSVGTLEPRKGQSQILKAFELLWKQGHDINLVLVGKQGWSGAEWSIERFVISMRTHAERDLRFFWLESISDEYLEAVYKESDCLIAASYAEGFGLPLIEAAHHGLPIIARDIPVFREVAGDSAFYFEGSEPGALSARIDDWLTLNQAGGTPSSSAISWLTWEKSSSDLLNVIVDNRWYELWHGLNHQHRIWAGDLRLATQAGERSGREIRSKSEAGWLVYGPYLALEQGEYAVTVRGRTLEGNRGKAHVEITMRKSVLMLAKKVLSDPTSLLTAELAEVKVSVPNECVDLEVRVWVESTNRIAVSLIDIVRISEPNVSAKVDPTSSSVSPLQRNFGNTFKETSP